jgi:tetratricopeptide (TPR) repeat protein
MSTESQARHMRTVVTGLVGFAAALEQELLATRRAAEPGSADCWAAAPLVAHNTEFKHQQVQRLTAIAAGTTPPEFAEIDHGSAAVYQRYAALPAAAVAADSWQAAGALIDGLAVLPDEDLLDPARHPWLRGRMLWLQVIVRGFWHPAGHLGEYYLGHGEPEQAVGVATRAVATAAGLDAPAAARGMASYNLACVQARAGRPDDALAALTEAVGLNPDVRANAARDPDLAALRDSGRLAAVLA